MRIFPKGKDWLFGTLALAFLVIGIISYWKDCIPDWLLCGEVLMIDAYLFSLLLISAYLTAPDFIKGRRKENCLKLFPSRPMGFLLFISFFFINALIFSSLYFSSRGGFYDEQGHPMQNKKDAWLLSLGTMTAGEIVKFSAEDETTQNLKSYQLGSDVVLFLGALAFLVARISTFERDTNKGRVQYDKNYQKKEINDNNIQKITGLPKEKWVMFSGVFSDTFPEIPVQIHDFNVEGIYPELILKVKKDQNDIELHFNLKEESIYIYKYILKDQSLKIRAKVFIRLLRLADEYGFKTLECLSSLKSRFYNCPGWDKFGFEMQYKDRIKLWPILNKFNVEIETLDTLSQTEEGMKFISNNPISWKEIFSLSSSKNQRDWEQYLKNIEKEI